MNSRFRSSSCPSSHAFGRPSPLAWLSWLARLLPRRRTALIVLSAFVLSACSSRTELLSGLQENEANDMLAVLLSAGIGADKEISKTGATVRVDNNRVAQAVSLLQSQGLPRDQHVSFGDVFRKDGLISSPIEERARYVYAMSQELSFTLSKIDGVLAARVHIVLPEQTTRGDAPPPPSSAAIFIKYRPDSPLDTLQPQMRRLIADSIPGLSPDKISFVFVPGVAAPVFNARPAQMRDLLGVRVAPESFWLLATLLGGALLITLGALAYALRGNAGSLPSLRRPSPSEPTSD
ncbi:type III secretion inner membrane ring lipoprotein SctJ [Paraburkholderia bonniea]|uniref:type III secretion system inner membrane ring lipoprotein SctJ n=1 Tax=Paraburkholderia bonniea TaxID=2152891 RepID=UPI0012924938|nr:type III secretion inner membrane ring lipoprotein SctJ [Paraburkholderia bonniea]WJF89295.1 type III secretion inner membrane ring lipoprotein SctJ [Paraburkholderia bonniea]WJF92611.1 type III secretion inner membrane ring lipoprotein SctJ [Paraburkholderia bonniea]